MFKIQTLIFKYVFISVLVVQANHLYAQNERDPFNPFLGNGSLTGGTLAIDDEDVPQILKYPVNEYRVLGIISSSKGGVALVQTPAGATYYVRKGDRLGADGFTVTALKNLYVEFKNESDEEFKIQAVSLGRSSQ